MSTLDSTRRYLIGILFLLGVVILWVGSSFLISAIFTDQSFDRPFFLTYFNTGSFSLYLLVAYVQNKLKNYKKKSQAIHIEISEPLNNTRTKNYGLQSIELAKSDEQLEIELQQAKVLKNDDKLTLEETAKLSLLFCVLWFCANWSTNASLALTTVGSSTILSSTSGMFTLAFGVIFKVERFTLTKLTGIVISFLGVVLVGISDWGSDDPSLSFMTMLFGDLLSLLGAVFYACYTTFLKLKVEEDKVDMKLFLGFVGLINLVIMLPIFAILHYTGVESFILPPTSTVWMMLILNALLGTFLSDYLWIFAVMFTSPLVVTLGLSLTIPFALIGDILIKGVTVSAIYVLGTILVVVGFFYINIVSYREQVQQNQENQI